MAGRSKFSVSLIAAILAGALSLPADAAKPRRKTASKPAATAKAEATPDPSLSGPPLPDGRGNIIAEGAVVLDGFTGATIFEKNAHARLYPASTTKILTALLIIEAGDLDREVVIEPVDTQVEPSSLGLKPGEKYVRRAMLYGLLLKSANDVACALARDNAGSVADFARRMTERAHSLGALDSNFTNPHGLPEKEHYTTAYDLALIARAAMQQPFFRRIVATQAHSWAAEGRVTELHNKNRLLRDFPGCTGLKTGWTVSSKHTLVSAALRNYREVIAVVLKTDKRGIWEDSQRLLTYALEKGIESPVVPDPEEGKTAAGSHSQK